MKKYKNLIHILIMKVDCFLNLYLINILDFLLKSFILIL